MILQSRGSSPARTKFGGKRGRVSCVPLRCGTCRTRILESEFREDWLGTRLLDLSGCGVLGFVLAFLPTFRYRRVAAGLAVAAALLSLPLYLDFIVPGLWLSMLGVEHPERFDHLSWNTWALSEMLVIAVGTGVCLRSLFIRGLQAR